MCIVMMLFGLAFLFSLSAVFLGIVVGAMVFKLYLVATTGICRSKNKLIGKTVVITGGDSGIGKETAIDLAKRGARVIIGCRNMKKGEQAKDEIIRKSKNKDIILKYMDLASLQSVRNFAKEINETESRLDILINSAGVFASPTKITEDGLEYQMQTNYFDLIIKTGIARIVNVCSVGHVFCRRLDLNDLNFDHHSKDALVLPLNIYCTSKLCKVLFNNELARKLQESYANKAILVQGKVLTANCLHPGIVFTDIGRYSKLARFLMIIFAFFLKTPRQGAQTSIYLAVADEVETVTGEYFSDCKVSKTSKLARDGELGKKLWEVSERLVGLTPEERVL